MINVQKFMFAVCAAVLLTACSTTHKKRSTISTPDKTVAATATSPTVVMTPGAAESALYNEEMDRVLFPLNSSRLSEEAKIILGNQIRIIKKNDNSILVEGHADERGDPSYNIALGERRANAVRQYLVDNGVDPRRIAIKSYGVERPAVDEHNEAAWRQNRRAVIVADSIAIVD